jgi:hypothetical protein
MLDRKREGFNVSMFIEKFDKKYIINLKKTNKTNNVRFFSRKI